MTAGSPQPETGLDTYRPQIANPDLTSFGFEATYASGSPAGESKNVEYRVGAPGGPYTTVASVPRSEVPEHGGWVANSHDFSKLILEVEDHRLVEPKTTTTSGNDLYEYSGGALRQVNVGVGSCGASIVHGNEENGNVVGPHALSRDGSRVFFEAVPGNDCSAAKHVYMRVNGGAADAETVDLGAYDFAAANASGTEVLLKQQGGEHAGLYLWSGETGQVKPLASSGPILSAPGIEFVVAEDKASGRLQSVYFVVRSAPGTFTPEAPALSPSEVEVLDNVYRYDIPGEALRFAFQSSANVEATGDERFVADGGRYYYFVSQVVDGFAAGAVVKNGGIGGAQVRGEVPTEQVYRYDSQTSTVQCVSCASSYDPEPSWEQTSTEPDPRSRCLAAVRLTWWPRTTGGSCSSSRPRRCCRAMMTAKSPPKGSAISVISTPAMKRLSPVTYTSGGLTGSMVARCCRAVWR